MRQAHRVADVRTAEAALMARLPAGALMRRASTALAAACATVLGRCYGATVAVLVGSGDNGGDALYAGSFLARRGAVVTAVLLSDRAHPSGLAALRAAGGRVVDGRTAEGEARSVTAGADLVLDGIVGIGGSGPLRPPAAGLVAEVTGATVAVDLPSGVDADTGVVPGAAVRADVTVTFGTYKPGLLVDPGAAHAGAVTLVDIGLVPYLPAPVLTALQGGDVAERLSPPGRDADKYARGVVGVVAGSQTYTGAAVLAVGGALAAGAGMVRYVGPSHAAELVRHAWPEAVVTVVEPGDDILQAGRVQAWVAGPGLGTDDVARERVAAVLSSDVPVLVDADGLAAYQPGRAAATLLTPHAGELARLLGAERSEVEAHRLAFVRRAVDELGATVLLKGSTTLVAAPDGAVRVNPTGTPYLGTAGSGDTLSGATGALLAAGLPPLDAGSTGAWLHGLSARLQSAGAPIRASDIAAGWARAVRQAAGTMDA